MQRYAATLVLFLLLQAIASALDPQRAITQYGHDFWDAESGLPTNTVFAIAQTTDGFLWFGSGEGLARFDGIEFKIYRKGDGNALLSDSVEVLLQDGAGGLWIGLDGGLSHFQNGVFRNYTAADGLKNERVLSLARSADGALWVGTRRGLFQVRGDKVSAVPVSDGGVDAGPEIWSLDAETTGTLWIGSKTGLHTYRNGHATWLGKEPASRPLWALARNSAGRITAASTNWVASLEGGQFSGNLQPPDASFDRIKALRYDSSGSLWIASAAHGLFRLRDGLLSSFTKADGLLSSQVTSLLIDRENSLWVGTRGGGVHRFRDTAAVPFGPPEGLSGQIVETLQERASSGMWVASADGGLDLIEGTRARPFAAAETFHNSPLTALADDRSGGIWVATKDGWIRHLSGKPKVLLEQKISIGTQWAQDIHFDAQGKLWIGMAGGGLLQFESDRIVRYTARQGAPSNFIVAIENNAAGGLWLATYGAGLIGFNGGVFSNALNKTNGLLSSDLTALYVDTDNTVWSGGGNTGLVRFRNGKLTLYDKSKGLFDNSVFNILEDGAGRLWMGCNRGIFSVLKSELESVANGSLAQVHSSVYAVAEGMRTAECNGNFRPSAWKSKDGRLWFATARGVVAIDPHRLFRNTQPPPVTITGLLIDNRPAGIASGLQMPSATKGFEIKFAGLSFTAPKQNHYRYRLEPFESNWVEAGSRHTATYTDLSPGNYVFRVQASNNDGIWNQEGASLRFRLMPHWFQTWWAASLFALLLALTVFAVHRYRMRQLEARLSLVMGERTRIARELHDTLLQGFSGMILHLEAIGHRMRESPDASRIQLDSVLSRMETYIEDARESISALRRAPASPVPLADQIAFMLKHQTEGSGLRYEQSLKGIQRVLPKEAENDLYRIALECVVNAMRHSQCTEISVTLEYSAASVRLTVADDGIGFDPQAQADPERAHFGLRGMRERATNWKGAFTVVSSPGHGCAVTVVLPK